MSAYFGYLLDKAEVFEKPEVDAWTDEWFKDSEDSFTENDARKFIRASRKEVSV